MEMNIFEKPLISIIIPAYNVEKYLRKCVQSIVDDVMCSTGQIEMIIIDDGSPDNSGKIADEFASRYGFISVIHKQNAGVAAARNTGIKEASGEWLFFVDSDDWLAEHALSVLCEKCNQHQDADILLFDAYQNTLGKEKEWVHFSCERIWTERSEICSLRQRALYFPMSTHNLEKTNVPLAAPWDKVYRRDFILNHALLFRENLFVLDDMIFNMEAFGKAKCVAYVKEKIYHYRYVSDSITNSFKADRVDQDRKVWKYIQEYMETCINSGEWSLDEKEKFMQAFYCRVIKSFSICCRLQFFHPANEQNVRRKIEYVKGILKSEPYQSAFHAVNLKNLEWKLRIMALTGRCNWGGGIYILHLAEGILRRLRVRT